MFKSDTSSVDFLNSKQALWKNTEKLEDFVGRAGEFAALIYVGGHGRKSILPPIHTTRNTYLCMSLLLSSSPALSTMFSSCFISTRLPFHLLCSLSPFSNSSPDRTCTNHPPLPTAMFDLAHSPASHALISAFASSPSSPIISAVCHGPAALAYAKLSSGAYLIANAPITGFSNAEEDTVGMTQAMPFSLEDALNENSGGKYEKAADAWGEKVVVAMGGKLITGQNPASARAMGERVLEGIKGGK